MPVDDVFVHEREIVRLADLKPHPRNYRRHTNEQLIHLDQSLREHGVYRNVVIAKDGTVLAGHGVVESAGRVGLEEIPVVRLDLRPDDPKALKLLAADNELSRFAEVDDRALTELLKEVMEADLDGLLGTGYDEAQLANLLFVTRPASEIADLNAAAHWVGMPEFEGFDQTSVSCLMVQCATEADRDAIVEQLGITSVRRGRRVWTVYYPPREREDPASILFEDKLEELEDAPTDG